MPSICFCCLHIYKHVCEEKRFFFLLVNNITRQTTAKSQPQWMNETMEKVNNVTWIRAKKQKNKKLYDKISMENQWREETQCKAKAKAKEKTTQNYMTKLKLWWLFSKVTKCKWKWKLSWRKVKHWIWNRILFVRTKLLAIECYVHFFFFSLSWFASSLKWSICFTPCSLACSLFILIPTFDKRNFFFVVYLFKFATINECYALYFVCVYVSIDDFYRK